MAPSIMLKHLKQLPQPDGQALLHSNRLSAIIREHMTAQGGALSFDQYMQLALYAPGLGYYQAGTHQLGRAGDYITAPEISFLFSHCVAKQCQQVLSEITDADILEFGAGSGVMAADILQYLADSDCLPQHYFILEVSAALQERQRQTIEKRCPELLERVHWLTALPREGFRGVILANEVLDAMPAHRFRIHRGEIQQCYVTWRDGQFVSYFDRVQETGLHRLNDILPHDLLQHAEDYQSEISLQIPAWITSVSDCLEQGLVLIIDYGFERGEYYHTQRHRGTLMCHYQHHAHTDPLSLIGLQDITAHVDFTAIADAATTVGLDISGYSTQANFLLACNLLQFAEAVMTDDKQRLEQARAIKLLTLPSEMGELFKVIALTRQWQHPLLGF